MAASLSLIGYALGLLVVIGGAVRGLADPSVPFTEFIEAAAAGISIIALAELPGRASRGADVA